MLCVPQNQYTCGHRPRPRGLALQPGHTSIMQCEKSFGSTNVGHSYHGALAAARRKNRLGAHGAIIFSSAPPSDTPLCPGAPIDDRGFLRYAGHLSAPQMTRILRRYSTRWTVGQCVVMGKLRAARMQHQDARVTQRWRIAQKPTRAPNGQQNPVRSQKRA